MGLGLRQGKGREGEGCRRCRQALHGQPPQRAVLKIGEGTEEEGGEGTVV